MSRLNYTQTGSGCPLIILHGLYGSGSNWHTYAQALGKYFTVYLLDQRNHGNSPHDPEFNYRVMTSDLEEFMNAHGLEKACLLGHSMGGKVAMNFAFHYPERVYKMVIIDIALRSYVSEFDTKPGLQKETHSKIIASLASLDLDFIESREEADRHMARYLPKRSIRQFLLKNLKRDPEGGFYWGLNITAIKESLPDILSEIPVPGTAFENPVLIIRGMKSDYIDDRDITDFRKAFSDIRIAEMDAGHWVHAEQPAKLTALLLEFLPMGNT